MIVHQFLHTLQYGDAISGEALLIQRLLREAGVAGEIFSLHTHEKLIGKSHDWREFAVPSKGTRTAVLLHYSIGSPLNTLILETPGIARGLIYHNLTPAEWYAPYNATVTANLRAGRNELPSLLTSMDLVLADSDFNRTELTAMGCNDASVLPLVLDTEKWKIEPNPGIAAALRGSGKQNILHVGRFAPNKCVEDSIKAFYFYHHKIEPKSHLWLIGGDIDTEIYTFELRRLVSELRLKDSVTFVGSVADCELKAFYQNSDLYLCMSEHEGFCVPLLEAMHFSLPVIAYSATAVPETVGDGALLVEEKGYPEIAELMHLLLSDSALRTAMIRRGVERASTFSERQFSENLQAVLRTLFSEPQSNSQQQRQLG